MKGEKIDELDKRGKIGELANWQIGELANWMKGEKLALRVICGLPPRADTSQAEVKMNILPLQKRRLLHIMQIGRWIAELEQFNDKRALATRAHAEGRKNLAVQKPNKSLYLRSFFYKACKGWNSLPTGMHIRLDKDSNNDKHKFKRKILELINQNRIDCE